MRERLEHSKKEFDMTAKGNIFDQSTVRIEPWGEGDLPLLKKLLGDPAMT